MRLLSHDPGPKPPRIFALAPSRSALFALVATLAFASARANGDSCSAPPPNAETPAPTAPATPAGAELERGNQLAAREDHAGALAAFEASERLAAGDLSLAILAAASAARSEALLGRTQASAKRLEALLERAADLDDRALRARIRLHAAKSLVLLSQPRRAIELLTATADDASAVEAWRIHSYALGALAEIYEQHGRPTDALPLARRALFSAQRAAANDAIYLRHWQIGRIQRALADPDAALASYRASVATLGGARELAYAGTEPVYDGLVDLLLSRAESAEPAARQALLAEARSALEDMNASELRDYFRDSCLDARRKTAPDTVPRTLVVYPIPLDDRLVLITSLEGALESRVVAVGRATLVEEVRAFRRALQNRTTRQYLPHADQLYRWLVRPLEPALSSGRVETLVFVPRGALNTIPMAALHDAENGRFLIERVPLAITPGLTLTEPRAIDRSSVELLAAGVSDAVQGYPGLDFVADEIQAVSGLFASRRLMNREFVAAAFEREVEQKTFGIVHVATHGEFSTNAADSYVLTYDGRISMDRLANLVGKTRFREHGLELLTLSACETAAGDDRAALGLAGAALNAGARSALATLWSVNDRVSAELITNFYRQLADTRQSRAQALRQAQLGVLQQRAYRHPAYWAPYLLISSWL